MILDFRFRILDWTRGFVVALLLCLNAVSSDEPDLSNARRPRSDAEL
jgi:hypothetical protein